MNHQFIIRLINYAYRCKSIFMAWGTLWLLNLCLLLGLSFRILKDDLNWSHNGYVCLCPSPFAWLLHAILLRINCKCPNYWWKSGWRESTHYNVEKWKRMCVSLFLKLAKHTPNLVISITSTSPTNLLLSVYRDMTLSSPYTVLFICL